MHDARDAEDTRLLESGDHSQLLENYVYLIEEACALRLRDRDAADEVGQRIYLRLLSELRSGKRYGVPFRVVVWKVVEWTCRGYEWERKQADSLPDEWDPEGPDDYAAWESDHDLALLLARLTGRKREVAELTYIDELAADEIAARLGITANNVYVTLHRAHEELAEKLRAS